MSSKCVCAQEIEALTQACMGFGLLVNVCLLVEQLVGKPPPFRCRLAETRRFDHRMIQTLEVQLGKQMPGARGKRASHLHIRVTGSACADGLRSNSEKLERCERRPMPSLLFLLLPAGLSRVAQVQRHKLGSDQGGPRQRKAGRLGASSA